jgi:mxaC protein
MRCTGPNGVAGVDAMLDFTHPWLLALLPLAVLPLLRRPADALPFSHVRWLPDDRAGRVVKLLWHACAMGAIAALVIGLAGPGSPNLQRRVTGTGGEILILMDRSASMDAELGRGIAHPLNTEGAESKKQVAAGALATFVARRPNDSFAFMLFGLQPMLAVPFTRDHAIVDAAMQATQIGRGMPDTRLDAGLVAAAQLFSRRARVGGRAIVLVSDGGARLDSAVRERIRDALAQDNVAMYFVYLRSGVYSPDLSDAAAQLDSSAEADLHRFFQGLSTPYHLFQAKDAAQMAQAMDEIDRRENQRSVMIERLPRQDRSTACFIAALVCCIALIGLGSVQKRSWA